MAIAVTSASSGSNTLSIGGGTGSMNAATAVNVYAAASTTTTTGTEVASFTISGMQALNGAVATPSIDFLGASTTGFYWANPGIGISVAGAGVGSFTSAGLSLGISGTLAGAVILNNGTSGTITLAPPTGALGTVTLTVPDLTGTLALNEAAADVQTIASGTAYTLTGSAATVTFGTTSPVVTLGVAGTYQITAVIQTSLAGATYAGVQTATYTLYRSNNTPATLSGSSFALLLPIVTTTTDPAGTTTISMQYTTANTTDTITVQGALSSTPSAGSVTTSGVTIGAVWLHP